MLSKEPRTGSQDDAAKTPGRWASLWSRVESRESRAENRKPGLWTLRSGLSTSPRASPPANNEAAFCLTGRPRLAGTAEAGRGFFGAIGSWEALNSQLSTLNSPRDERRGSKRHFSNRFRSETSTKKGEAVREPNHHVRGKQPGGAFPPPSRSSPLVPPIFNFSTFQLFNFSIRSTDSESHDE